ncbi:HAD family phosphatase [Nisaea sp.]|uniref:HAD family hydrolase n=1 Tax=Nisaea sp. TaxID=2024842 RepID=UPI002B26E9E3|nr:HAD family phosphatase [Nisaea sp.]
MQGGILRGTSKRPVPLRLDALLFDLDGTLVDTTELHVAATNAALATFDRRISRQEYEEHLHGGANDDTRHFLFPDDPEGKGRDYVELKEQLFRNSVVQLERMPGLTELLDWAAEHSLKTAVVTNAPRANADLMLRALGLADRFDAIVVAEEVPLGKPDPGPYLEGLSRIGCTAEAAIGFEDSPSGLTALIGAGVFSVAITGAGDPAPLIGADLLIDDFRSPALQSLRHVILKPDPS